MSAFVLRAGLIGAQLRACGAFTAAVLLAACARDPAVTSLDAASAGNWRIERQLDGITGGPISSALLVTRTVSTAKIVFPPPVQIRLLCFQNQPAVLLAFEFMIGSTRIAEFSYRFDNKPGHLARVRFTDDYRRVIIEDRNEVAQFVGEMVTSKVLYLLIRSINRGRNSAEFHLDGALAAINAAFAGCPVAPGKRAGTEPMPRPAT